MTVWGTDSSVACRHAEPEQAAQALSQLQGNRKPSPNTRYPNQAHIQQNDPHPPPNDRYSSPAGQSSHYRPLAQNYSQQRPSNDQSYVDNQFSRLQSPPPQSYGYGRGENQQRYEDPQYSLNGAEQYHGHGGGTPDPGSRGLYDFFRGANESQTGNMTSAELGKALVNSDRTRFDSATISSLMRMFASSSSTNRDDLTLTFDDFKSMWEFLAAWRRLFEQFDVDRSGRISRDEFSRAMTAFGYRLSPPFVTMLYNTFNDRSPAKNQGMSFDLFVQACISLKRMTDVFKKYDDDRDGYVTLSFEEFLTEVLRLRD